MAEQKRLTGLKKRQQIEQASRTVFLWVAAAAAVVSIALVVSETLVRQAMFNNKVLGEKYKTDGNLKHNLEVAEDLKNEVNKLVGSTELNSVKQKADDSNLKVVLDALPTENEPLALGSSLQLVVLPRSNVSIEALTTGDESAAVVDPAAATTETQQEDPTPKEILFTFTVNGTVEQIKNTIINLEKTIRPMHVTAITLEGSDASLKATVQAKSFYQPPKTVELKSKTVKP